MNNYDNEYDEDFSEDSYFPEWRGPGVVGFEMQDDELIQFELTEGGEWIEI